MCDDKDPPWMNDETKVLIKRKNRLYLDYATLEATTADISNAVSSSKRKYKERLTKKLNDPRTVTKTYRSILKTFVNGAKIPLIPLLLDGKKLVTDFLVKANLFNNFFNQQCTAIIKKALFI